LALLLLIGTGAGAARAADVVALGSMAEYEAFAAHSPDGALVSVVAPWCGHSRALKPEFEKAAVALHGVVPLATLDGTVAEDVATMLDVKGYPTVLFVRAGVADE